MQKVETIENQWDVLYKDYPGVYDEFAAVPYQPDVMDVVIKDFALAGKRVADIGCGTGKSTFKIAEVAEEVDGIEPEEAMLEVARENLQHRHLINVDLLEGTAQEIPLPDKTMDAVTAITTVFYPPKEMLPPFIAEAQRILKPGGTIIVVSIAPNWYGGDLHDIIDDASPDLVELDEILAENGFSYRDVDCIQDYGTVDKIVRTYGFIFGRAAIDYIKHHGKTRILWRLRIRHKSV